MPDIIPDSIAAHIKAEFPAVKLFRNEGRFTAGIGVEVDKDGRYLRNGWHVKKDTDFDELEKDILDWLRDNADA